MRAVRRLWDIEGYPDYFFGDDNQLYRFTARGALRRNPKCVKRYTVGYTLKSRFYSLTQLKPLLRRHDPTTHSAGF